MLYCARPGGRRYRLNNLSGRFGQRRRGTLRAYESLKNPTYVGSNVASGCRENCCFRIPSRRTDLTGSEPVKLSTYLRISV